MQERRRIALLGVTLVLATVLLVLVLLRPRPARVTPVVVPSAATMLWAQRNNIDLPPQFEPPARPGSDTGHSP